MQPVSQRAIAVPPDLPEAGQGVEDLGARLLPQPGAMQEQPEGGLRPDDQRDPLARSSQKRITLAT